MKRVYDFEKIACLGVRALLCHFREDINLTTAKSELYRLEDLCERLSKCST